MRPHSSRIDQGHVGCGNVAPTQCWWEMTITPRTTAYHISQNYICSPPDLAVPDTYNHSWTHPSEQQTHKGTLDSHQREVSFVMKQAEPPFKRRIGGCIYWAFCCEEALCSLHTFSIWSM